jgi:hypothetical protein
MKGEDIPERISAGAPFALLHGHRAGRGVSQGFPDGAPKRRVLDRHPGLLNAAEMRAKGEVWKGDSTDPERPGSRRWNAKGGLRCRGPVQN